ncbi:hypothetical protein AVEN_79801-1 [Araneus ventricosus]|uniref:RING-type domain-containing protein n=1 Tax=Araneus ventricosus TaxID=182803 RepID=A0A4Y2R4U7_ARAVE|nr:hypothetical protein AVEN_79801-1 [Araneus ventricosus]
MLHSLKPFSCAKCNSPYASKDGARYHDGAKFPRILTCHHSICEKCLYLADKKNKTLPCPTCKEIINLEGDDLSVKFPPDVHALGILSANIRNALPSLKVKMVHNDKRYQSLDSLKGKSERILYFFPE